MNEMRIIGKIFLLLLLSAVVNSIYAQGLNENKTTIFWDSSKSMENRDLEQELSFLDKFFKQKDNTDVTLLFFSNTLMEKAEIKVTEGNWEELRKRLMEVSYDGGTSYSSLSQFAMGGDILIFTDGYQNTNIESPYFQGNVSVINSSRHYNPANLNLLAILSRGGVVNFAASRQRTESNLAVYYGTVQGAQIQNRQVEISIKGRNDITSRPEADGKYELRAAKGDTLVVRTFAGESVEQVLGSNRNIDIWLGGVEGIELQEIVVTGSSEEEEEEKITGLGPKKSEAVGFAVQSITEDDIAAEISTTANNAVQGKFSGLRLGQNDDLSQAILRPSNSILSTNYGLIVLDGVPLRRSDSSTGEIEDTSFIDPQNIANITILKGLAATNRFGSLGANGVILITTKTATFDKTETGVKRDLAMLTDNIYDGKLKVSSKTLVTPYLRALKNEKTVQDAYNTYLGQRDTYGLQPAFYVDIYDYFKYSSPRLAARVLTNVLEDDTSQYNTLRSMLLKCREAGLNSLELDTAQKIMERFPDRIQSYFDLAMALKNNGQYQQSLNQLIQMSEGSLNTDLDFSELKKPVEVEIKNLVYQHRNNIDLNSVPPQFLKNVYYDARVVFEWSYASAEFDLQFVNPQKRFFTWEHNSMINANRLQAELEQGFAREEFEIFGEGIEGEWLINVKYLGNTNSSDETPTFLQCKVMYNFGKPNQSEELFTLRLHEKDSDFQFVKLKL